MKPLFILFLLVPYLFSQNIELPASSTLKEQYQKAYTFAKKVLKFSFPKDKRWAREYIEDNGITKAYLQGLGLKAQYQEAYIFAKKTLKRNWPKDKNWAIQYVKDNGISKAYMQGRGLQAQYLEAYYFSKEIRQRGIPNNREWGIEFVKENGATKAAKFKRGLKAQYQEAYNFAIKTLKYTDIRSKKFADSYIRLTKNPRLFAPLEYWALLPKRFRRRERGRLIKRQVIYVK